MLYSKSWRFVCNTCFYMDSWQCTSLVDYYAPLFFTKIASLSPEEFCASLSFCGEVTFIRLPRHEDTCTLCHEIVTNLEDPDMEVFVCYTFIISIYSNQWFVPILFYIVFFNLKDSSYLSSEYFLFNYSELITFTLNWLQWMLWIGSLSRCLCHSETYFSGVSTFSKG